MKRTALILMVFSVFLASGFAVQISPSRMDYVSQVTGIYEFEMKPIAR